MTSDSRLPAWQFDELGHAGPEHVQPDQARLYDEKVGADPGEDLVWLTRAGLGADQTLVDFGAGTGTFALAAAPLCRRVVAVDVSPAMNHVLRHKARQQGLGNVECVLAGFLSYRHQGEAADFVYSRNALHHLPDFWKVQALTTVARTLRPGGVLLLRDLIYSFDPDDSDLALGAWIRAAPPRPAVAWTREDLSHHVRAEFSTYDWLLEPMLARTGFEIEQKTVHETGIFAAYLCRKA